MPNEPDDLRFSKHHGRRPWGGRPASGTAASPLRAFSRTEAALAHPRAGDGDAAALKMERRLRGLLYTGRLAMRLRARR
jgi:hypothetical protein